MHFKALYLHSTIPVFCHYFPNTQIILGHKNLTKYQIEYHYYVRNSSNTALGYLAHLKTLFIWRPGSLDANSSEKSGVRGSVVYLDCNMSSGLFWVLSSFSWGLTEIDHGPGPKIDNCKMQSTNCCFEVCSMCWLLY